MNVVIVSYEDADDIVSWRVIRIGSEAWKVFCAEELSSLPDNVDLTTVSLEE
jgi:hypothetical protein